MRKLSIGKFFKRQAKSKVGLSPGTLVHIGERRLDEIQISFIDYDEKRFDERVVADVEECFPFKETPTVTWINIDGLHEVEIIEKIGKHFDLHPLLLEDIVHTGQRPKIEDFEGYLFTTLRMLSFEGETKEIKSEQLSLILGSNFVISFQETIGDVFDIVRERIRKGKRIRKLGPDYLTYALLDAVVDSYFVILENLGEHIEDLEDELITDPSQETLHEIHALKREMLYLRKSVWPLREVISTLERSESKLIKKSTLIYMRDVYDHTIQVIDTIETYRDMVAGMLDTYLSSLSNRMNEVMKVLTIIATIFIPLTFIAGVYGMNFNPEASPLNMPELNWYWGYPTVWIVMLIVAVTMIVYFKKKNWL
ncbi:MAG: magnesium/cobalt transporter CorA [Candidatus Altiarchaeota archaeon]